MRNLIKKNLYTAKRFNYTLRYIDDIPLIIIACLKELIYPQLTLKKMTECFKTFILRYLLVYVRINM